MGRAIGETMAVLMVVGNAPVIPESISSPVSTLTKMCIRDRVEAISANLVSGVEVSLGKPQNIVEKERVVTKLLAEHQGCLLYTSRCV